MTISREAADYFMVARDDVLADFLVSEPEDLRTKIAALTEDQSRALAYAAVKHNQDMAYEVDKVAQRQRWMLALTGVTAVIFFVLWAAKRKRGR